MEIKYIKDSNIFKIVLKENDTLIFMSFLEYWSKRKKYFKKIVLLFISIIVFCDTYSQNPAPAKVQSDPVLIMGATTHLGNGRVVVSTHTNL